MKQRKKGNGYPIILKGLWDNHLCASYYIKIICSKKEIIYMVDSQGKVIGIATGDAIIEAVIDDVAFEFKIVVK